jgi:hypothetical protein
MAIGASARRARSLGCHNAPIVQISQTIGNQKWIPADACNFFVTHIRGIAFSNGSCYKVNHDVFIKQKGLLRRSLSEQVREVIVAGTNFLEDFNRNFHCFCRTMKKKPVPELRHSVYWIVIPIRVDQNVRV